MAAQWELELWVNEANIRAWQLDNKEASRRVLAGASLEEARKAVADERMVYSQEQTRRLAALPDMRGRLDVLREIVVALYDQMRLENDLEAEALKEWTVEKIAEHELAEEADARCHLEAQGLSTAEAARAVSESRERFCRADADEIERRAAELVVEGQSEGDAAKTAADEMFRKQQARHKGASRAAALLARGIDSHRDYEIMTPSTTPQEAAIVQAERTANFYQQRCAELERASNFYQQRCAELEADALSQRLDTMQAHLNSIQMDIDRLRPTEEAQAAKAPDEA